MLSKIIISIIHRYKTSMARFYNNMLVRAQRVKYSGKPIINGKVIIQNRGTIELGIGVLINNSSEYNPVGLPHPTILCTQNPDAKIRIGNNVGISGGSLVAATSITIGDRCQIGGGSGIWDTDFHPLSPEKRREHATRDAKTAPIVIGDDVFIGARVMILKGVTIGNGAVIGAGAVVTQNVPEGAIAFGNPLIIKE